ncbi:MAG TPA: zf-HC2 domain-containing protein [Candidatus Baltobacteraceae bacterium]|jgi:anti-sigma factor RsiW
MHCSSCEPLLDRYVEGTLPARRMLAIGKHLRTCAHCTDMLTELKVIDALLETTGATEPAANFTFAVMAEVRSMPKPRTVRHPAPRLLLSYLAAAWVVAVVWFVASGATLGSLVTGASALGLRFASAFSSVGGGAGVLGHSTPSLAALGVALLAIDAAIALGVGIIYLFVRPRLAAAFAPSAERS